VAIKEGSCKIDALNGATTGVASDSVNLLSWVRDCHMTSSLNGNWKWYANRPSVSAENRSATSGHLHLVLISVTCWG